MPAEDFNREQGEPSGRVRERLDDLGRGFRVRFSIPFYTAPRGA